MTMVSRAKPRGIIFSYVLWQGLSLGSGLKADVILEQNNSFAYVQVAEALDTGVNPDIPAADEVQVPSPSEESLPAVQKQSADEVTTPTTNDEESSSSSAKNEDLAPPSAAEPPPNSAPLVTETPATTVSDDEPEPKDDPVKEQFLRFHQFSLGLEFSRPKFSTTDLPLYKDYYGKEALMLGFRLDWDVLRNKYLALGLLFRFSHYSDSGYASQSSTEYVKDGNAPLDLTLIPLQLGVSLKLTPFSKKWLVINGWMGMERLFFQETRGSIADDTATASTSSTTTDEEVDSGVLTNKGWAQHIFTGFSLNILLNPLEEQPVKAASFMGIERVYLSPYFETSVPSQNKDRSGVKFKRVTYGVAFIFETRGI